MSSASTSAASRDSGVITTRDVAERHLRSIILDGAVAGGERLNEVLISEELGISRGPLREAIQRLSSEGLLVQVRNKGAFVVQVSADELRDLYEARIALERRAVELTVERQTEEHIAELVTVLDEAQAWLEGDDSAAYPSDHDFHRMLVRFADNDVISRFTEEVNTRLILARSKSARDPVRAQAALDEHRAVVVAIMARDAEKAGALMQRHLLSSRDNALGGLF